MARPTALLAMGGYPSLGWKYLYFSSPKAFKNIFLGFFP
jgi:hypothetical protein